MVAGDGQYLAERERLEMEKLKQQCLADELEKERQEIQRFREHEQVLVQKELEELQAMKQQILDQQEEERQAHLLMQKETYAQQQQQLEQIQRLQEQLRLQLEEQKLRQLFPGVQEAVVLGPDGTVLARKITDSGCQTDEEDETISNAYTAGRKKKNAKKSVDSCVQTDDEDQEDWEENRNRRPRTARGDRSAQSEQSKPSTPTGTQKKVKRTLPNPPSEEESTTATATTTTGQTAYSTNSARRRMCRNSNMARAKILQDIDRELDMVERESSKLRKRQAELDEEEKEIDAKLRDPSSSSLRLKGDGESGDGSSYQTPSGRTKPTSLPIVQSGRGRIPIVAQNSEEESPLSPVGQPMGMARASAGPLPPISADSRDQFGSCLSLQDPQQQQQYIREEPTRGRGSVLLDDLQGTMSDSEAYHLRHEETDWFEKPRDGRADGLNKRQGKGPYYPFPHLRVKLQRDPKDRTVSGNGLGIRIVGGKEVPNSNGDIGAYVAKVLPGGAAEQTGKILEGMQVLEWNGLFLTGKTYEEVQGLVGQPCNEAEMCVRLDLNMLAESEMSQNLDFQEHSKSERPPRSPGVDPMQLAAELQKVSQQQAPLLPTSSTSSPAQPGSPSISKKRHGSKSAEGAKIHSHPISGEIQLQIHYDKQLGNLIVHVLQARNLAPRDNNGYSDPFVKVYLLPGRGQVMVVQNASAENKRKSKHAGRSINPEWNQTVIYKNIHLEQLKKKTLEVSVWDYDKCSSNDFLGEVLIDLSNTSQLDNAPRWVPLKEQSEGDHHRRSHSGQSRHSSKTSSQHSSPKTGSTHDIHDSPKSSVTKSRSHGVFPDPAKDTQVPSIEKSHSSPGTAKPSQSEGHGQGQHSRSHAAHTKSTTRHHQDSGRGSTIAAGDALVQSQQQPPQRLQPSKPRRK
uniref:Protein piccolo-like n=1 Tax=Knipowitschia caucasica TaxID=637954 RepID=A0AAV2ITL3_KNICA